MQQSQQHHQQQQQLMQALLASQAQLGSKRTGPAKQKKRTIPVSGAIWCICSSLDITCTN